MARKKKYEKSKKSLNRKWLPNALIITGILAAVISIFVIKNQEQKEPLAVESAASSETPEQQYERYLAEGEPIFLFFHSNNCYACMDMIETVTQVYPEYMDKVKLIDVNVYDSGNEALLRKAMITAIPTQIFINDKGEQQVVMGAMIPDDLRSYLSKTAMDN